MNGFLVRLAISAFALWVATRLVSGLQIDGAGSLLLAALLLGVVNAIVRPLLVILTFPLTLVTLGLFLFVVNAAMLGLVAVFVPGMHVAGFGAALFGSIVVSLVSWAASAWIGPRGTFEVISFEKSPRP